MKTLLERIQESMNKYELEDKLTEHDFYDVNENRQICEAKMMHIRSAYGDKIVKDFASLLERGSLTNGTKYIEKENIKYMISNAWDNEYNIRFVDLSNAMKTGKKVDKYYITIHEDDIYKFLDFIKEIGIMEFINNRDKYSERYKLNHSADEKGVDVFSPFALPNIKPLKNLPKKWKHGDIVKVLANGQYTSFTGGKYSRDDRDDEIFGLAFIEGMYEMRYAWNIFPTQDYNNPNSDKITDPTKQARISLYYVSKYGYDLDVDLTIKPN